MKKNKISKNWLSKQRRDIYVRKSKLEGYRSRAIYKLKEIDDKFKIIKNGIKIVDLGSAPGSWSQYLAEKSKNSKIVLTNLPSDLKNQPLWICEACNMNSEKWEFICKNCGSIDSFNWPKSKLIKNKKKDTDYVKALLKDSFSHFPKMK